MALAERTLAVMEMGSVSRILPQDFGRGIAAEEAAYIKNQVSGHYPVMIVLSLNQLHKFILFKACFM